MKSPFFKKVAIFVCLVLFAFSATGSVFANGNITPEAYSQQFEAIFVSEDRGAHEIGPMLSELYYQNPLTFLQALILVPKSFQDTIISYLLVDNEFGANEDFLDSLNSLVALTDKTDLEKNTLDRIISIMNHYNEEQEEIRQIVEEKYALDKEILLKMIDANLETNSQDRAFFHALANAYLRSPKLFSEIISQYDLSEIEFLSRAISYDLHVTNRTGLAVVPEACKTQEASFVAELIYSAVENNVPLAANSISSTEALFPDELNSEAELMLLDDLELYSISLSDNEVGRYDRVSVSVSFGSSTALSVSPQKYTVKIYGIHSTSAPIVSQTVTIPAGSSGTTASILVPLNITGYYALTVKIYDSNGTLCASGTSPLIRVRKIWTIQIVLPSNRSNLGILCLYDSDSIEIDSCNCLGKSVSGADPMVEDGNTPTGVSYAETKSSDGSLGYHRVIRLDPRISGQLATCGRTDLLIHAGSSCDPILDVTNGCVRVSNADLAALVTKIDNMETVGYHEFGRVTITEE